MDIAPECTGFYERKSHGTHRAGSEAGHVSAPAELDLGHRPRREREYVRPGKTCRRLQRLCDKLLAPVTRFLTTLGIEYLMGTTIHAYTSTQVLVDVPRGQKDVPLQLCACNNGCGNNGSSFPELRADGYDLCGVFLWPTDLDDIVVHFKKEVTVESVNAALKSAADGKPRNRRVQRRRDRLRRYHHQHALELSTRLPPVRHGQGRQVICNDNVRLFEQDGVGAVHRGQE